MFIRKFYYLSCLLLMCFQWSNAQVNLSVRYGKGIVNNAESFSPRKLESQQTLGEDDLALALQLPIFKKWGLSLQTEVEIQTKRYQQVIYIDNTTGLQNMPNLYYKVQYKDFQIPLFVRKDFKLSSKWGIYVMGGAWLLSGQIGLDYDNFYEGDVYNPSATFTYTLPSNNILIIEPQDIKIAQRQLDARKFGTHILLGTGFTYQLNRFRLGLEYRYTNRHILPSDLQAYQSANIFLTYILSKQHEK